MRVVPPVQGDETSDEEEEEKSDSPLKEKQIAEIKSKKYSEQQSKAAFKKILNAGRRTERVSFDDNTFMKIQAMDLLVDEVLASIKSLENSVLNENLIREEKEILKQHLMNILEYQIEPILKHLN